ncbi:hypothetical protein ACJJTC_014923 [Scirpophaga incertulas]
MSISEKLVELKAALQNINHDVVGLCEVRRLGEDIIEDDDYIMYCIGETKGLYGVGFLIKKKHKEKIKAFTGISERVCTVEIEFDNFIFTIIQAYVPTESSTQEDIEKIYDDLAKAHETTSTKYIICMGDFNAQIGTRKAHELSVTGRTALGRELVVERDLFNTHLSII